MESPLKVVSSQILECSHSFLSFKMEKFKDGDEMLHCAPIRFYTIIVLINWFLAKNKSRSAGVTYQYTISALKGS